MESIDSSSKSQEEEQYDPYESCMFICDALSDDYSEEMSNCHQCYWQQSSFYKCSKVE